MLTVKGLLVLLDKVKTWAELNCEPDDAVQVTLTDDARRHHWLSGVLTELSGASIVNGRYSLNLSVDTSK